MTTRDYIEIAFTLIGVANVWVLMLIKIQIAGLKEHVSQNYVSKTDFDTFTETMFRFMNITPLSKRGVR
jgi:hypothetical protein